MKKIQTPNFNHEKQLSEMKDFLVAGVDEVGRGAIAGPIVAGAVIFTEYSKILKALKGINDSKVLTLKQRVEFDQMIRQSALLYSIGVVESWEIDKYGIGGANILAFKRALDQFDRCDFVLIDGRKFRGFEYKYLCLEKGESKSVSIAAASIIAKVYRDNLMDQLGKKFNEYGFASNKGYGSGEHYKALESVGPSEVHRKTFLKKFNDHLSQNSLFGM